MDRAMAYRVEDRAAFFGKVGDTARQKLMRLFFAFGGLVLATHLLSQASLGQNAFATPVTSCGEVASTRLAANADSVPFGVGMSQTSDSGDNVLFANAEGPFTLTNSAVRIPLKSVSRTATGEGSLVSRLGTLKGGRSIYLIVKELSAQIQPGVIYHLYLDLPSGAKPARNDAHYVGTLNFFNAPFDGSAPRSDFFFSYDITPIARKLRERKLLAGQTTLTVSPASAPDAGSAPTIGRVELVEQ